MIENIVLIVMTVGAIYYIYKKTIKSGCDGECSCGKK
jgi:hypothetical protein